MANAVILILVIGYCLFLIYKQVQNRKPENISAVQAVAVPAAVAAAAARAGQKETRKNTDRRKAAVTKTVRSEARGSFLCAKKRGKNGKCWKHHRLHALRLWCFSGDLSGRCPDLSGRALDSEMEKEKERRRTGKWLM